MGRAFGGNGSNGIGGNGSNGKEMQMPHQQKQQQSGVAPGAPAGGINPNMMIQVMAQQLFLQEQHKMKMRIGLQQAQQQAMTNRQQVNTQEGISYMSNILLH